MQPSSLIFVLVVAIWAVYLLQYWIKRRDHLSTVRSVDRFSAAMRVLDDHRMGRRLAEPTPRSYSVAPTRAARPEVTVKHAETPPARVAPVVGVPRRLRGLVLLGLVALLPVVALVAAFGPLPWWTVAVPLVGAVVAFAWLRRAVVAERSASRRVGVERRRAMTPRVERPVAPTRTAAPATPARAAAPAAARPVSRSTRVYDVAEESAPSVDEVIEPVARTPVAEPEPGTWQPTPVPRPMYTMKAKAERPAPAPVPTAAAPVPAGDVPQVIEVEDEDLPALADWA
ncbi:hypothetical protein [Janibacter alittae]|uniref:Uncharacterized protein n=1 Tax=Janibacter alittae TaxID=3115209 RepID=A0ABZ2MIE5_9MICO